MEHFDAKPQNRVKEKSVYLLHLDTPRIIILSCVLIGVLIVAFLVGMNLSRDGESSRNQLAQRELMLTPPPPGAEMAPQDPSAKSAPPTLDEELAVTPSPTPDAPSAVPPSTASAEPDKSAGQKGQAPAIASNAQPRKDSGDVLSRESIKEIIPPANAVNDAGRKSADVKDTRKSRHAKSSRRERAASAQRTVEVSSKTVESREAKAEQRAEHGYSIQVGSFDTREKARRESQNLKNLRYDAFVENAQVNGRRIFRVKIGPIASRQKAVKVLSEVQEVHPYEGSYLTKE